MYENLYFFYIFLFWGKEGNASCTVAPRGAVCGTPGQLASGSCPWTNTRPDPTKTPLRRSTGHIPLREIDGWTYFKVEIGKPLIRPEGTEFTLSNQPPIAFHETRRIPAFPHKILYEVLQCISGLAWMYVLIVYRGFVSYFPYCPYCHSNQDA